MKQGNGHGMKYGFTIPSDGIHTIVELAVEAEAAGWDAAFYWDGINIHDHPGYDPWVTMAAMAVRTERVRLGAMVSPLARRRPWKVARETVSLDLLSNGRLVLPVGLGALDDGGFVKVGEPTDRKTRAELLDESLEIPPSTRSSRSSSSWRCCASFLGNRSNSPRSLRASRSFIYRMRN